MRNRAHHPYRHTMRLLEDETRPLLVNFLKTSPSPNCAPPLSERRAQEVFVYHQIVCTVCQIRIQSPYLPPSDWCESPNRERPLDPKKYIYNNKTVLVTTIGRVFWNALGEGYIVREPPLLNETRFLFTRRAPHSISIIPGPCVACFARGSYLGAPQVCLHGRRNAATGQFRSQSGCARARSLFDRANSR